MALKVGELYGELDLKTDQWDRGMGKVRGSVGKLAGFVAAAGIGAALTGGIWKAVNAASDLQESMSKVNVVFGDSASIVTKFAEDAAVSMGMAKQQALEASGTFGNLFVSMGMGGSESAKMSTSLVQLAGDLASFNNIDPTEALDALRSGLVGETEPMRRLGVNMNDATLKAQALAMGLKWQGETLPPLVKAQAAYALIMEQTSTAQGDYARTSGGFANQLRTLKAQITDVAATIGAALLPVAINVVEALRAIVGAVVPAFRKLKSFFSGEGPGIAAAILEPLAGLREELAPIMAGIGESLGRLWAIVGPALVKVGEYLMTVIPPALAYLRPLIVELAKTFAALAGAAAKMAAFIKRHWSSIMKVAGPIFTIIKTIVVTAFKNIADTIRLVLAIIRGDWSGAGAALKRIAGSIKSALGAIFKALGKLLVGILQLAWAALVAGAKAGWRKLKSAAADGASSLLSTIRGLPGRILSALGSLGGLLYDAGKSIVQGLINGITDKLGDLWDKVSGIGDKIRDLKGPLDYDRVMLKPAGNAIMDGLIRGITDKGPALAGVLKGVSGAIAGGIAGPDLATAGGGIGGGAVHVHVHVPGGTALIGEAENVGRILAPHVERALARTSARRHRRR